MTASLPREYVLDLTGESLAPGWLRRCESRPDPREVPMPGVWRTGPQTTFRMAMIEALDNAVEIALVCAFFIADEELANAMLRAAERGVRVYALTASEHRVGKHLPDDDEFSQRMAEEHKRLLDRLAGKVLVRSAEHFHAKFLVVDPQALPLAKGFISTANFNKALSENYELGVLLQGGDARDLATFFHQAFWCEAERELVEIGRLLPVAPPPAEPEPPSGKRVVATLKTSHTLRETLLSMIHQARREILLSTYGMDMDHAVIRSLIEAARSGVQVTVLTRPRPAIAGAVIALAEAGASVYGHDKLHAKTVVADGAVLVLSANMEASGLDHGFEIGTLLSEDLARGVETTLREWIRDFPWVFRVDAKRGEHLGDFLAADRGLRDGMLRVVPHLYQRFPDQIAADALSLAETQSPKLELSPQQRNLPQKVSFTWNVVPPKLPKNAKQRQLAIQDGVDVDRGAPPVFDHAGRAYVLLRDEADIPAARAMAEQLGAVVVVP